VKVPLTVIACAAACGGCGGDRAAPAPIKFLHTFGADETELFNATMSDRGIAVDSSLVPFARGQQVISEILDAKHDCPDLIRIDATWLPGLRPQLAPAPAELAALDWTPEAAALAQLGGTWWGVPQAVDGLLVVRDSASLAPASARIEDLLAAARAARSDDRRHPLGLRVDGYWLVPWLRAEHADLAVGAIDGDGATRALATYAALFGDVASPPPPAGSEAPDELRRWNAHEVAYWVTGPWQLGALHDADRVAVSALAGAPRGGQLLVVPTCAKRPAEGWRLAAELASVPVEIEFAKTFATVPTRKAALEAAPALSRAAYAALRSAELLPREAVTPLLFDDLNPALAAVVAGDATPDEAIEGVRRGWRRLTLAKGAR
jgi:ABC-type glycerol-3-phosphate transport system substrate-binding protein